MGQVAHIRYDGGALLLPAQDPYDREVVFEEAEFCARRHGSVGVQLGRKEMRVSTSAAHVRMPCHSCRQPVGPMSFLVDRRLLCAHCAKQHMGCEPPRAPIV
jgi:hypothetical protein